MQQRHFYAQRGGQMFLQKLFIRFYSTISIPSAPLMLQQWASATGFCSCSVFLPLWWNMFVSARHLRPIKILKEHFVCICQAQTTLVRHNVLVIWKRLVAASSTEVPNLVFAELEQTGVKDLGCGATFSPLCRLLSSRSSVLLLPPYPCNSRRDARECLCVNPSESSSLHSCSGPAWVKRSLSWVQDAPLHVHTEMSPNVALNPCRIELCPRFEPRRSCLHVGSGAAVSNSD